jgi:hypothetical protein
MWAHDMRLFLNILSALSLLLLGVVLFFWIRSYSRFDGILHFGEATPLSATVQGEGSRRRSTSRGGARGGSRTADD